VTDNQDHPIRPFGDHPVVGDFRSAARISRQSVDWICLLRFDTPPSNPFLLLNHAPAQSSGGPLAKAPAARRSLRPPVDYVLVHSPEEESGIWEARQRKHRYLYSQVMCRDAA